MTGHVLWSDSSSSADTFLPPLARRLQEHSLHLPDVFEFFSSAMKIIPALDEWLLKVLSKPLMLASADFNVG